MMKKLAIILSAVAAIFLTCSAAGDIEEIPGVTAIKCFKAAPNTIFTMMDNSTRLDMIDYFEAGVERPSVNSIGGECYITDVTPYSMNIVGGTGIEYQVFVLNQNTSAPLIGIVQTVETPIRDSEIHFYDTHWQSVDKRVWTQPTLKDWLNTSDKKARAEVEDEIPFIMSTYSYNPETSRLTVLNNMTDYYVPGDKAKALDYLKPQISYTWDGKRFKLDK